MEQKIREMREAMTPEERTEWITSQLQNARLQLERSGFTTEEIGGIMMAMGGGFLVAALGEEKAAQLMDGLVIRQRDKAIQEPTAEESTPGGGGYLN